jgi:hypothetical protein
MPGLPGGPPADAPDAPDLDEEMAPNVILQGFNLLVGEGRTPAGAPIKVMNVEMNLLIQIPFSTDVAKQVGTKLMSAGIHVTDRMPKGPRG